MPSLTYKSERIVNTQRQIEFPFASGKTILSGPDDQDIATNGTLTINGVTVLLARDDLTQIHMYGFATTQPIDRAKVPLPLREGRFSFPVSLSSSLK